MDNIGVLWRLFKKELLETIDPNKPENAPVFRQKWNVKNQAFVNWYESGGRYVMEDLEQALMNNIVKAITHSRNTADERFANLRLLDDIERDAKFIDRIGLALVQEEQRKKAR